MQVFRVKNSYQNLPGVNCNNLPIRRWCFVEKRGKLVNGDEINRYGGVYSDRQKSL